jgi:NIMA (never in mitosis gene a)-related kinase
MPRSNYVCCAPTPRSPFESQGATLYDVFQRIGRCEYQPLPADRWSSPLRQLVSRLLQPEPTKRPSLQEVCSLAQQIVASQVSWSLW